LYSEEALKIYQGHLTPSGVLCAWMSNFHAIPYTVAQVFPYVDQFENEFVVAGNQPIDYHIDYMDRAAKSYASLTEEIYGPDGRVGLNTSSALDFFLRDREQILKDETHKQTLRDMKPWLEYYLFLSPVKKEIHRNPDVIAGFEARVQQ
jgi:hypothetical protein